MSGATPDAGKALPAEIERLARVPLLPLEGPLVRAVRGLEATKAHVDMLLMLLETVPGAAPQIASTDAALVEAVNNALAALRQFNEVRSCQGQA